MAGDVAVIHVDAGSQQCVPSQNMLSARSIQAERSGREESLSWRGWDLSTSGLTRDDNLSNQLKWKEGILRPQLLWLQCFKPPHVPPKYRYACAIQCFLGLIVPASSIFDSDISRLGGQKEPWLMLKANFEAICNTRRNVANIKASAWLGRLAESRIYITPPRFHSVRSNQATFLTGYEPGFRRSGSLPHFC